MNLICRLFGHRWQDERDGDWNLPWPPPCVRCGVRKSKFVLDAYPDLQHLTDIKLVDE